MPIFGTDLQLQLNFFSSKGCSGNINEMVIQYFISMTGYIPGASYLDYINAQFNRIGNIQSFNDFLSYYGSPSSTVFFSNLSNEIDSVK